MSVLMMLAQLGPVFASTDFSARKFLACESKLLKQEKLSIAIDKEQKQDIPDIEKISSLEKNMSIVNRFTGKHCTDFTAQAF